MRIILVAIHPYVSPQAVPLANAYLISYPRFQSSESSLPEILSRDYYADRNIDECVTELIALAPELLGFSLYVWNREFCRAVAAKVRHAVPGVRIFAGGPEVTADMERLLSDDTFDFLIVGEGERTFDDLCQCAMAGGDPAGIPGVAVRGEEGPRFVPRASLLELDQIPSPWLNGVLDTHAYQGVLWQLSRGCGFACSFCFDAQGEAGVRRFSLERVEAELRHFAAQGVSQVFVLDSTFNLDMGRAKTILRLIRKHAHRIHFHFEVRSECIDREMAQLFSVISCSLQIGLQSSDAAVLERVGRAFNRKAFADKISLLNQTGAVFGFDVMYGLPGDDLRRFRNSIDFALSLYPNHLDIFPLAILPGTALARQAAALGLRHLADPPYTLLSSSTFSEKDLDTARCLANACDIFYSRGKAVAWFNSVMRVLGLKPSGFLDRFARWLETEYGAFTSEAGLEDDEIWQQQRRFLARLFKPPRLRRFLALVLDLVDYHYHYAAVLLSPPAVVEPEPVPEKRSLVQCAARLTSSTRMVKFSYNIDEILDAGEPDIGAFAATHGKQGSYAVMYAGREGIYTESLDKPYFRLLESLDGRTPCDALALKLGIPRDAASEFLQFAALEGIVSLG